MLNYFKNEKDKLPLLLQRQGRLRFLFCFNVRDVEISLNFPGFSHVIIGIEETESNMTLFTLDPTHHSQQIATLGIDTLSILRHEMDDLLAEQYQIVVIRGVYTDEEEKEVSYLRWEYMPHVYLYVCINIIFFHFHYSLIIFFDVLQLGEQGVEVCADSR